MGSDEKFCLVSIKKSWLLAPAALAATILARQNAWFVFLFVFRYLRLIVHIFSFHVLYRMTQIPKNPTVHPSDCTVIVPSIDPGHSRFSRNLESILLNVPDTVLIVTVGKFNLRLLEQIVGPLQQRFPRTTIRCLSTDIANKRHQVCHSVPLIDTPITVLADDSVYWPSANFLRTAVAPFESAKIGCVGTHKRVVRDTSTTWFESFFNFLGCIYLERHNFDIRATNAIDGGVFVVSGRTSLIRSQILQDADFISGFTDERFFWGKFGPLNADDDNFITRWLVNHGWDINIQYGGDATIETHLGTYPRYLSQVLRWTRTTWRSNPRSLFVDRTVWYRQPWCVYAVYLTSFVNFALFYDIALLVTLTRTTFYSHTALYYMVAWIFASKMVKLIAHFRRCPGDIIWIPGYLCFAYYHSLIKLYALFTFYVTVWGGRNLAIAGDDDEEEEVEVKACTPVADNHGSRSFEPTSPAIPTRSRRYTRRADSSQSITTPWGEVTSIVNPAAVSTNVLESQLSSTSTSSASPTRSTRSTRATLSRKHLSKDQDQIPTPVPNKAARATTAPKQQPVKHRTPVSSTTRITKETAPVRPWSSHSSSSDCHSEYTCFPEDPTHIELTNKQPKPAVNATTLESAGTPDRTKIEYTHMWYGLGYFTRALTWFTRNGAAEQSKIETFAAKAYPNGPQRDWWKHAEDEDSFDFFEHKNDLEEDEDYAGKIAPETFDNKAWFRQEAYARLESKYQRRRGW